MYLSFARGQELRHRVTLLDQPGAYNGFMFPVIVGRPSGDVPAAHAWFYCGGVFPPPQGPGIPVRVSVSLRCGFQWLEPRIPQTVWTFHNTSAYDIVDGVILQECLNPQGWRSVFRYIPGLRIPAGGSLTVVGQMEPEWIWAFGGILDAPERSPVIAFDSAGLSPSGKGFYDVFTAETWYPDSGLAAAVAADRVLGQWGYLLPSLTVVEPLIGYGRPLSGYVADFAPPLDERSTRYFNLYAFSTGELVGSGTASAHVPEPGCLSLLAAGALVARLMRGRRRV